MEWSDEGIVLGLRRHGEANAIVDVMTLAHGRHLGLVRGGAGARLRPILQPGNQVALVWRARLDEHLGHYTVEGLRLRAASLLSVPLALYGLTHICGLARLLPERDPHPALHAELDEIVDLLLDPQQAAVRIARFELRLLAELGFGLDLDACAATGTRENLVYVSPKSGRAVSRAAGAPWEDKLIRLPAFLAEEADVPGVSAEEIADAFTLTGFFLTRHVLEPRGSALPEARAQFLAALKKALPSAGLDSRTD